MKCIFRIILFIWFVCIADIYACSNCTDEKFKTFPLCGGTWLFGKGDNERVYATVSPSVPTHLIMVTFPSALFGSGGENIEMRYALLEGLSFKSTGHLLNEVTYQFERNFIQIPAAEWRSRRSAGQDTLMSVSFRDIPDTVWSCDKAFAEAGCSNIGRTSPQYIMEWDSLGVKVMRKWRRGSRDTLKHREMPVAWIETPFASNKNRFPYSGGHGMYYKSMDIMETSTRRMQDYCQQGNKCYEFVDCNNAHLAGFSF